MKQFDSPIFIGGLMKTGTSLLRKLISQHPKVFGGAETHWFSDEFMHGWDRQDSTRMNWLRQFYQVSDSEMKALQSNSQTSIDFFKRFMAFTTQRENKSRWTEKTPDNILHIDQIFTLWSGAKVLITVRDFRDTYASWKKNEKGNLEDFIQKATRYKEIVERWSTQSEKVFLVNYHDLVKATNSTMRGVFDFLGEEYFDWISDYSGDQSEDALVKKVLGKSSPTAESLGRPIFTDSIGQWHSILNEREISMIEASL